MNNRWFFLTLGMILIGNSCSHHVFPIKSLSENSLIIEIPIVFAHSAVVEVQIEKEKYLFEIDLGSADSVIIEKKYLDKIQNKKNIEKEHSIDLFGNHYSHNQFIIPYIKIQNLIIDNIKLREESPDFLLATELNPSGPTRTSAKIRGRLGIELFKNHICFFDLLNSVIYLADSINTIEKSYPLNEFTQLPFVFHNELISISGKIDTGTQRFILDTGANPSVFRKSDIDENLRWEIPSKQSMFTTKQLIFENTDFGEWNFCLLEFGKQWENINGILGIDFFKEHIVILDFKARQVYIKPHKKPEDH